MLLFDVINRCVLLFVVGCGCVLLVCCVFVVCLFVGCSLCVVMVCCLLMVAVAFYKKNVEGVMVMFVVVCCGSWLIVVVCLFCCPSLFVVCCLFGCRSLLFDRFAGCLLFVVLVFGVGCCMMFVV